jgi:hypothetical protein
MTQYADPDELKTLLQPGDVDFDDHDTLYSDLVTDASAAVDQHCGRVFTLAGSASAREMMVLRDGCTLRGLPEFATLDDLVVKTGLPGAYDTTLTIDTHFWVPTPADTSRPYFEIRPIGLWRFRRDTYGRPTVEVTAKWGWAAVPDPVKRATLLWATRLFARKDSPAGVMGFGDMGAVRLPGIDPDVAALLEPFVRLAGRFA